MERLATTWFSRLQHGGTEWLTTILLATVAMLYFIQKLIHRRLQMTKSKSYMLGLEVIPDLPTNRPYFGPFPFGLKPQAILPLLEYNLKRVGSISKFSILWEKFVILNEGPVLQTFLQSKEYGHLSKPDGFRIFDELVDNGVALSNGKFWEKQRKILLRSQTFSSIKLRINSVCKRCIRVVHTLDDLANDQRPHQVFDTIGTTFLEIILDMMYSVESYDKKELTALLRNNKTFLKCWGRRVTEPFVTIFWKLHPCSRKSARASQAIINFTKTAMQKHIENVADKLRVRSTLDDLLEEGLDEKQIMSEIHSMIFAGHETASYTTQYFLMCMATNPDIQAKCQEDIDQCFGSNTSAWNNGNIDIATLQSGLKYLERCILETLRMYPPAHLSTRKLFSPLDIEFNGSTVRIPAKTYILFSIYWLHRNPENFPNPTKFDPDRFLPENIAKRHPFVYLPFSAGPRNCLGQKFAMLQLKAMAAYLLRSFEFSTPDEIDKIPLIPYLTLTPERNYRFILKKRNNIPMP